MSSLRKNFPDRLVFAAAVLAAACSCAWLWQQRPALRRLRSQPVAPRLAGLPYKPMDLKLPQGEAGTWRNAPTQSRGSGWLYELFTPPVIYYSPRAGTFTVTPPLSQTAGEAGFGLELLAVKAEQYRLQLVGYFGGPGDYIAAFATPDAPETLLARTGRRFESLGLTLTSFDVKKVPVDNAGTWPVYDVAAHAVLRDERTGGDVVLDSRVRKFTATPLVILKMPAGEPQARGFHEGDTFVQDSTTYRIERVQLDPAEVVIARELPGLPVPEIRVLHPAPKHSGQAATNAVKEFPERPATAVAANGR